MERDTWGKSKPIHTNIRKKDYYCQNTGSFYKALYVLICNNLHYIVRKKKSVQNVVYIINNSIIIIIMWHYFYKEGYYNLYVVVYMYINTSGKIYKNLVAWVASRKRNRGLEGHFFHFVPPLYLLHGACACLTSNIC